MRDVLDSVWLFVFFMIIICLGLSSLIYGVTTRSWREEAVEEGHAEYYIDKEHMKQWRWLPVKKNEKE